jgi:hypothetical protein
MMALAAYRAGLCPSCGLPRAECMADENEDRYKVDAVRCHATTARVTAAAARQKNGDPHLEGLLYSVELEAGGASA